jgi:hypothetical protein
MAEQACEQSIFLRALELTSPVERAAYLDDACRDQSGLRAEIEALLSAHQRLGGRTSFAREQAPPTQTHLPPTDVAGTVLAGRYKLLEEIGEGGMGTIWMARQTEPVQRLVAVKLLKAGMGSKAVLARFEQERQALALMDHPNIAKVLDAGAAADGRPFFVMELVKGVPITRYCDEHRLTPKERLKLFVPVCQAVQHAHHKGIVHRDIKPSNVMVAMYDDKPVIKVIDFGVAKAIGQQLTDQTLHTGFGAVVGTIEYMSPEQASFNQLDVDSRSDIYSLGVLLYELLTGVPPFNRKTLEKAGMMEMLRVIREQEPSKPSMQLSTAEGLPALAASRGTEPVKLTRLMRGELDWMVMKCLEKDRSRRYETANGLAMDLERFLADEPVVAGPPTTAYRLRKFAKKNRAILATAATIAALLIAGIAVSTWQAVRAWNAEQQAQVSAQAEAKERRRAEENERRAFEFAAAEKTAKELAENNAQIALAVSYFLQEKLLLQADTKFQADSLVASGRPSSEAERDPRISVLLDRAAAELTQDKMESQFPNQPLLQSELLKTVGNAYRGIGKYERAIEHLERARQIRTAAIGADHLDNLTLLGDLATANLESANLPEAIRLYEQVRDGRLQKLGADHTDTLTTLHNLATAYTSAGKWPEAIQVYEQVRDSESKALGANDPKVLTVECNLGWAYLASGRQDDAIRMLERVRTIQTVKLGADHPDTLATLNNLAIAYQSAARLPEAIRIIEQVRDAYVAKTGPDHPHTLTAIKNVANAYEQAGRLSEAIRLYEQVYRRELAVLGADHRNTLITRGHLGRIYTTAGRPLDAIPILEPARAAQIEKFGAEHVDSLTAGHNLALAYVKAGRLRDAIQILEPLLDIKLAKHGIEHQDTLATMSVLADAYQKTGRLTEAIRLYERVRDVRVAKFGLDHPRTLLTLSSLAKTYEESGMAAEAIRLAEQSAHGIEKRQFQDEQAKRILPNTIGCYERAKDYSKAEAWRRKWLAAVKDQSGGDSADYAAELAGLGANLIQQSKYAQAEPLLVAAYEGMIRRDSEKSDANRNVRTIEALEHLVKLYDSWDKPAEAAKWRAELEARKK